MQLRPLRSCVQYISRHRYLSLDQIRPAYSTLQPSAFSPISASLVAVDDDGDPKLLHSPSPPAQPPTPFTSFGPPTLRVSPSLGQRSVFIVQLVGDEDKLEDLPQVLALIQHVRLAWGELSLISNPRVSRELFRQFSRASNLSIDSLRYS